MPSVFVLLASFFLCQLFYVSPLLSHLNTASTRSRTKSTFSFCLVLKKKDANIHTCHSLTLPQLR